MRRVDVELAVMEHRLSLGIGILLLAAWEYGTEVRRDAMIIQQFGLILGLTSAQLDQLFIEAAKIKA